MYFNYTHELLNNQLIYNIKIKIDVTSHQKGEIPMNMSLHLIFISFELAVLWSSL